MTSKSESQCDPSADISQRPVTCVPSLHEDAGDLYVDVRLDSAFRRARVTCREEQADLLSRLRRTLQSESRVARVRPGATWEAEERRTVRHPKYPVDFCRRHIAGGQHNRSCYLAPVAIKELGKVMNALLGVSIRLT